MQQVLWIKAALADHGWSAIEDMSTNCLAKKEFEILDGIEKEALVWFSEFKAESSLMVTAEYQSEGNNVLGATGFIVQANETEEAIKSMVSDFVRDAEFKIDESYGRRLRYA